MRRDGPESRRDHALRDRARDSHAADREQFLDMELEADAEHEQDHADFRKLLGEARVGHEARSMRPDENPAEQIPDNGREPEPLRQVAENQGGRESPASVAIRSTPCMGTLVFDQP